MRRLMFIIPLALIGSFLIMPDEGVRPEGPSHNQAETFGRLASASIIDDWSERYVDATALEDGRDEALAGLRDEIESTTLPYEDEQTSYLKAATLEQIESAIVFSTHEAMVDGYRALKKLEKEYEVRP